MMRIEGKVYNKLKDRGYKVATAESCTGGLLAGKIINASGASDIIDMSFVTYSNEAKSDLVFVNSETISTYNVVSEQVAEEMAKGAAKRAGAHVGLSTTGVAGPKGGSKDIPVGTVCFGIAIGDKCYTYRHRFKPISRQYVRRASVNFILKKLNELL